MVKIDTLFQQNPFANEQHMPITWCWLGYFETLLFRTIFHVLRDFEMVGFDCNESHFPTLCSQPANLAVMWPQGTAQGRNAELLLQSHIHCLLILQLLKQQFSVSFRDQHLTVAITGSGGVHISVRDANHQELEAFRHCLEEFKATGTGGHVEVCHKRKNLHYRASSPYVEICTLPFHSQFQTVHSKCDVIFHLFFSSNCTWSTELFLLCDVMFLVKLLVKIIWIWSSLRVEEVTLSLPRVTISIFFICVLPHSHHAELCWSTEHFDNMVNVYSKIRAWHCNQCSCKCSYNPGQK